MDNRITFLTVVFFFSLYFLGCKSSIVNTEDLSFNDTIIDVEQESNKWRKLSFCLCIYMQDSSVVINESEGSVSGYLQTTILYDMNDFELTKTFIDHYIHINDSNYRSSNGADLGLMKCIDFYESKELDEFILKLEKGATTRWKLWNEQN